MGIYELIEKYGLEEQVEARMKAKENGTLCEISEDVDTKKIFDKLVKVIWFFVILIIFSIIGFFITKKLEDPTNDGILWSFLGIFKVFVDPTRELLINLNLLSPENQFFTTSFTVYCIASSVGGYYVATRILGIGLIQGILKWIFCPLISPLIMPFVIIVEFISLIKNSIILIINR